MEAERNKDNHGWAFEIFSRSMASGSYLLLDSVANRLKLPLSLCQDENVQLYFSAEETEAGILCGRQLFSTDTLWSLSSCCFLYCSIILLDSESLICLFNHVRSSVASELLQHFNPFKNWFTFQQA